MKRKEWKAFLKRYPRYLKHWNTDFLKVMPGGNELKEALPFVETPNRHYAKISQALENLGFKLLWSTLILVEGYHHAKGTNVYVIKEIA